MKNKAEEDAGVQQPDASSDWRARRCGHNYSITTCPEKECVSRELYDALDRLVRHYGITEAVPVSSDGKVWNAALNALAKARGETR